MSLWFKDLPAGWEEAPLTSRLTRNDGGVWGEDPEGDDSDTFVLRSTEQRVDGAWNIEAPALRKLSKGEAESSRLEVGDLVVTKSSGSDLHIGKTSLVTAEVAAMGACYSNFMQRLRLDSRTDPRFVHYWMNNELCREQFVYLSNSTSGLANLNGTVLGTARLGFPERGEQERIANFLDDKTARIDALIAEKERLRGSLYEWRSAELTRICFGGQVASTPTGNEWIAALPEDWKLVRLKHVIVGVEQGWSPECEARLAEQDEWGVLKAGASNGGVFRQSEHKALPPSLEPLPQLEVKVGDVLISRASGSADLVGSFAFVYETRPRLMLSDKNFRLKFAAESPLAPELVAWMCNTEPLRQQVRQFVSGADGLAKNIGSGNLRELWLALPPKQLQAQLVVELRSLKKKIDGLEQHLAEHIARLREYRSSLISAAVTGQLAV